MGVSAVPGSGKTQTLSCLAAKLVAEGNLADDQEVLVVTLVNSAVDNFARRVVEFVRELGLLPQLGYRVRTLHGLAHDIVRERPGLLGLANDFQIVDEREADQILQDAAETWASEHAFAAGDYLLPDLDERKRAKLRRDPWPEVVTRVAGSFIRMAKDLESTPAVLRTNLNALPEPLPLLEMGWSIYEAYQRALAYRGAVDYDDLIRLALQALELDGDYLKRLRYRWPFILEDEAQDSSRLQERILRLLAGGDSAGGNPRAPDALAPSGAQGCGLKGNWVRVGDPNQAIYETFTTASPYYLRRFLAESGVIARELPNSGRSTRSIMDLANYLVDWTLTAHPVTELRQALAPSHIEPTPPGDPQENPPDDPDGIQLVARKFTPAEEVEAVIDSLARWLPDHGDWTVAVLVPRNDRGEAVVRALKGRGIDYVELLKSTQATREVAGSLGNVLNYLADPTSAPRLEKIYKVWRREDRADPEANASMEAVGQALHRCRHVEEFVWPRGVRAIRASGPRADPSRLDEESLACLDLDGLEADRAEHLIQFRTLVRRWQGAAILPADQLVLTIAQDLFDRPADLAVSHKLAALLGQASEDHPDWRLPELTGELALIARNERKFLGFSGDDTGFDPERHRGKVVVTTVHKAKGLEWDRVYLMSVNNYDYPSAQAHDTFISEPWYIRDNLNLEAEALAHLRALFSEDLAAAYVPEGEATRQARLDYAAERLRLLYVGITRAKRELIVTWNSGRQPPGGRQPAASFTALRTWWEGRCPGDAPPEDERG